MSNLAVRATTGHARFNPGTDEALAFVSAGSGASPLIYMFLTLAEVGPKANVRWLHAARAQVDILFSTELEELQQRMPNLEVSVMLSEAEPGWLGLRGLISRRHISAVIPDFQVRVVYCCGPAGFMNSVRRIHAADGARHAAFHVEHFAPVQEVTLPDTAVVKGETYKVTIDGKTFPVKAGEMILMAASRQQVVVSTGWERTTSSSGQLSGLSSSGDTGVTVCIGPSGRLSAIKQALVFASKLPDDLTGSSAAS